MLLKVYGRLRGAAPIGTARFKAEDGKDWQRKSQQRPTNGEQLAITAEAAKWSPVGVEGLRVKVTAKAGRETELWIFSGVPGVIAQRAWTDDVNPVHDRDRDFRNLSEDGDALRKWLNDCDSIWFAPQHIRATIAIMPLYPHLVYAVEIVVR